MKAQSLVSPKLQLRCPSALCEFFRKTCKLQIKAVAVPELNSNNSNQSERYRRRERLMRLLCSRVLQIHL